jgi:hypothetical protein
MLRELGSPLALQLGGHPLRPAPMVSIVIGFERRPKVRICAATEQDTQRIVDWVTATPALAAIVGRALDEERGGP